MLEETLPKECEVSSTIANDLWLMRADATQIHQVLLNLCVNACVTVQSEVGRGTTFRIGFPALADPVAVTAPAAVPLPAKGHGEEILVVDDEEPIRLVLQRILTAHGYVVSTAADGVDGAAVYFRRAAHVKLVITDVNMPQVDGVTILQLIRKLNADVPFIVCSGTGNSERLTARVADFERIGVKSILPKPFSAVSLLTAVHRALGGEPDECAPDAVTDAVVAAPHAVQN